MRLKSDGKDPAVFSVQQIPGSGITVVPSTGIIGAGESTVLKVKLTPPSVHNYDAELLVNIRNGRVVKLPFKADAIVPDVNITQDEFNFDQLVIGGVSRQLVSIDNKSTIQAAIQLDVSAYPEFSVELPDELAEMEDSESIMTPLGAEGEEGNAAAVARTCP